MRLQAQHATGLLGNAPSAKVLAQPVVKLATMAFFVLVTGLMACIMSPGNQPDDAGVEPEPGPQVLPCETVEDCPEPANYDCTGVCYQRCAADEVCRSSEYCSDRGYCEAGCRDSSTCGEDEVCAGGNCIDSSAQGACGSKCDCLPGQVCTNGLCGDPPATCASPDDCGRGPTESCEAYQCNGFTQLCFDPNPRPCSTEADCEGRPECTEGCSCNAASQCVPSVACTPEDERDTCGYGYYCANGNCDVSPDCTPDSDCDAVNLTCNEGTGKCERSQPCASNGDCTIPPATYCDLAAAPAECTVPNCLNGGATCDQNYTCADDGRCVPQGTGQACNSDADCLDEPWPNTQFCSFDSGTGECAQGCRTNASCPADEVCNDARQCVSDGGENTGPGGVGDSCSDYLFSTDCGVDLICFPVIGVCL
ncbi:MAG: hypothetical protein GY822_23115 [Deltaproteobacteria bacterium]|nr:hypothetical protein [Deltaproteobacteria bacterium]